MQLKEGDHFGFERRFTLEDVERFAAISGDRGVHHVRPDERGRIMLQGLLTATLPTKLGGDLNYIARSMNFEFPRPVFAGDTITAEAVVEKISQSNRGSRIRIRYVCRNQEGKEVLLGTTDGVIRTTE
jgi:3-hydroxybutyryl-CoA dehydratase